MGAPWATQPLWTPWLSPEQAAPELVLWRAGVGAVGRAVWGLSPRLEGLLFSGPSTDSLVVPPEFSSEHCRAVPCAKERLLFTVAMCAMRSMQWVGREIVSSSQCVAHQQICRLMAGLRVSRYRRCHEGFTKGARLCRCWWEEFSVRERLLS